MKTCYLLPGVLGSEMLNHVWTDQPIFPRAVNLAKGSLGTLRLAADGISPGGTDGIAAFAGDPLEAYYGVCRDFLRINLTADGYVMRPMGYDWRMRTRSIGSLLASDIRQHATASEPCAIVGHSIGGLVARAAWAELVASGETNLVRRIITLGTAHQGCYAPVSVFSLADELLTQLSALNTVVSTVLNVSGISFGTPIYSPAAMAKIIATWPSFYEVLPHLGSPDAAADPHRASLYDASNWPARLNISQALLDEAKDSFQPFLRSPASLPPPWVLTTLAGTGCITPDGLVSPGLLGDKDAYGTATTGDGRVMPDSALIAQSSRYQIPARHVDLPSAANLNNLLAQLVLDERSPPAPPPAPPPPAVPVSSIAGQLVPMLAGPPIPVFSNPAPVCTPAAQAAGTCC